MTASAPDRAIPHDPAAERLGQTLIDDVVAGDFDAFEQLLAPDVRFRALTPRTIRQELTAAATRAVIEGWFEGTSDRELLASSVDSIVDRLLVGFRIRLWEEGIRRVVEQRVVARVADGRLTDVALVCSGFAIVEEAGPIATAPSAGVRADRRLDGLGLSCATLTPTIRAEVLALEPGQTLEILTDDPSAEDGLRSWGRMTGHHVVGREQAGEAAARYFIRRAAAPGNESTSGGTN